MNDDRDLVTRLREYRMDVDSPDVVHEAADEIERLRAERTMRSPQEVALRVMAERIVDEFGLAFAIVPVQQDDQEIFDIGITGHNGAMARYSFNDAMIFLHGIEAGARGLRSNL
jgi:hypothetical protein